MLFAIGLHRIIAEGVAQLHEARVPLDIAAFYLDGSICGTHRATCVSSTALEPDELGVHSGQRLIPFTDQPTGTRFLQAGSSAVTDASLCSLILFARTAEDTRASPEPHVPIHATPFARITLVFLCCCLGCAKFSYHARTMPHRQPPPQRSPDAWASCTFPLPSTLAPCHSLWVLFCRFFHGNMCFLHHFISNIFLSTYSEGATSKESVSSHVVSFHVKTQTAWAHLTEFDLCLVVTAATGARNRSLNTALSDFKKNPKGHYPLERNCGEN